MSKSKKRGRARAKAIYHGYFEVPGGHRVKIKIYLEYRDNIRFSTGSTGLLVRLPAGVSREEMNEWAQKAQAWYIKKLKENENLRKKILPEGFEDGQELQILGETWRIKIEKAPAVASAHSIRVEAEDKVLALSLLPNAKEADKKKAAEVLVYKILSKYFLFPVWNRVCDLQKEHFPDKKIGKLNLRRTKRQWGSCSAKGNISLSIRLLFAPPEVLDYVIIHELAHLIEKNHSDRFWALVEKAMPDYREKEQWLKEHGENLAL